MISRTQFILGARITLLRLTGELTEDQARGMWLLVTHSPPATARAQMTRFEEYLATKDAL